MRTFNRLTTLTATAVLAAVWGASPATAQTGGGANNLVQVVNSAAEHFAHRAGVQAAPYAGDSSQSTNLARADSRNCTGCTTQAAALQAVFLTGDPSVVQASNAAVATNSGCSNCLSYAYAYQYVVTTPRAVSLSPDGQQAIRAIQAKASAVIAGRADDLDDLAAMDAELSALAAQLKNVVDDELRAGGHAASTRVHQDRQVASG